MTIISMKQTFQNPIPPSSLALSVNRNTKNTLFLQRRRANEKKGRAIFYINRLPGLFQGVKEERGLIKFPGKETYN